MTKEELKELRKELTGYPSIDKPQYKYYKKVPTKNLDSCKTIYDMVFSGVDMNDVALEYLDGACSWTFGKLKKSTDKCMDAFKSQGIKEGDTILLGVTNTPELISSIIALVSIGATVKLFDIRANAKEIAKYANAENCKYMIALDKVVLPKVQEIIDETYLEKVFVMRPANSLTKVEKLKYLYENRKDLLKIIREKDIKLPKKDRYYELTRVIKKGNINEKLRVEYDEERPSFMVQSSGTTGKAKTIVHPEKSAVEFAKALSYSDLPLGKGKTVLVALPPWIAYGIGDAILMPLALGSKVSLCAGFEPDSVYRNIGKFTFAFAAPFHYRYIRDHYDELTEKQKEDLRKVDCMITGGDKYSAQENEADEKLFGTVVANGYGNNENWGALTVNPVKANRYGSVGIPKYGEEIIIYDNENEKELPYGQIGEVCTYSKTQFIRYEGNEEATKKSLKKHKDGKVWLHTGDQGYIDEDGFIFLSGRKERVITRLGFKLSAYTIEDAISSLPFIKSCITVEVPDEAEEHVPMSFVVLEKGIKMKESEVQPMVNEECKNMLKENELPKYIKVVDELKYTDNNKYDFRYYENIGKAYVEGIKDKNKEFSIRKKD